jgi:hypothetical protein
MASTRRRRRDATSKKIEMNTNKQSKCMVDLFGQLEANNEPVYYQEQEEDA